MAQRVGPVTLEDKDRDADRTIVDVRRSGVGLWAPLGLWRLLETDREKDGCFRQCVV